MPNAQSGYINTTIYTPKGTPLEGKILIASDYSSSQKLAIKNQTMAQHPNATFLADATQTYNCHSYAFHLSEGQTPTVWINQNDDNGNPNVYKYWTDGSFIQICNESDADKVHYYNGDHSAVISTTAIGKYESKWGPNIRIRHDPIDVPSIYNGNYRHYYASTKISGDASNLCSGTRTFSVKNISGASYIWTCSSTLSVVGASNTPEYMVQQNGSMSGDAWVKVQISTGCSSITAAQELHFSVGPPSTIGIDFGLGSYNNMEGCGDQSSFKVLYDAAYNNYSGYLYVTAPNPNINLNWREISNSSVSRWTWNTSNNGHTLNVSQKVANKYLILKVTATNACGSIEKTYTFGSDVCPFIAIDPDDYLLAPNPAANNFSVSVNTATKGGKTVSFAQIRVYDGTGNLKKQLKYESGTQQAQINITDLRPGYYYVEISNGKTSIRKPLVIQ